MNKGILAYCYDGSDLGIAFDSADLKNGPVYPAVAMLHRAGFQFRTDA